MEPTKEQIVKYEDLFFKKSRGTYAHTELQGLYDGVNDSTNAKVNQIKEDLRQTELYKFGLEMFMYNYHVAESMKWHMDKLKSELVPEVAEAIKRFPTGVSYGVSLREEINKLEKENAELRDQNYKYYGLSEQLKIDKKKLELELNLI